MPARQIPPLSVPLPAERPRATPRRLAVIVNPSATAVSQRLRRLVVNALRGPYEVVAVDTHAPGHATELARRAVLEGAEAVVAVGGDGTANEVANALAGGPAALFPLPGGRANVYCRMLGIATDPVDATERLLALADGWPVRRVDLGRVNGRCFLFSSGVGLDASVVRVVDSHPRAKARLGEWYYAWVALRTFAAGYVRHAPRMRIALDGHAVEGVTAIVQNGDPYTYFGDRPVRMGVGAELSGGGLAGVVLVRAAARDVPSIALRALRGSTGVTGHRHVLGYGPVTELTVSSADRRPLPLQVDGDHIADVLEARYECLPRALAVLG
ncbi:MAG TPA: diacylglycerol kinase family protein [Solirubrobacteraceae bacterium]|nr:diacylglycerol kinase family protein [Solirubrobacteraceae bacterium]